MNVSASVAVDGEVGGSGLEVVPVRDYAGVPTAELVALYEQYSDTDLVTFAARIGMDERDLKKIVLTQDYAFVGWTKTEKILEGLGLNSSVLLNQGLLHEVPARDSRKTAQKLAEDEFWRKVEVGDRLSPPTEREMNERITELLALRDETVVKSPEQAERLRRDSERAQARTAQKKKQAAA